MNPTHASVHRSRICMKIDGGEFSRTITDVSPRIPDGNYTLAVAGESSTSRWRRDRNAAQKFHRAWTVFGPAWRYLLIVVGAPNSSAVTQEAQSVLAGMSCARTERKFSGRSGAGCTQKKLALLLPRSRSCARRPWPILRPPPSACSEASHPRKPPTLRVLPGSFRT